MDKYNSSFDVFEHMDSDLIHDEQSDKTPFHDLNEEGESQTFKAKIEKSPSIVCCLRKFVSRPNFFYQLLAFIVNQDILRSSMIIWFL